jgi:hypothetical protein
MKGARAIMPTICLFASGRSLRLMKWLPALADGQLCQTRSSGFTD